MRFLLNGVPTSNRMRFASGEAVLDCPFCKTGTQDDSRHWFQCNVMTECLRHVLSASALLPSNEQTFFLQVEMERREIQLVAAVIHAIWRCRSVLVRGHSFGSACELARHMSQLIEDPWLRGCPLQLTKAQKRAAVSRPPVMPSGCMLYSTDGAARRTDEGYLSSYGVMLRVNGQCISKRGVFLGDCTNNVAEYRGCIAALQHIVANPFPRVYVHMDSYLVVQQLNGFWACRNAGLKPLY